MTKLSFDLRYPAAVLALASVASFGGCASSHVERKEDNLSAAGFLVRPANTPARLDMLKRLPPHRFVRRVNNDKVSYVFADPNVCGCLYVGSEQAYNQYKRDRLERHIANEQAYAAQEYNDAQWNWDAWGPWDASYGFSYGPGLVGW